jgi:hypothetical protein
VYGDYNASTHYINPYNTFDASLPPYIFEAPRQILFGVKLNWE